MKFEIKHRWTGEILFSVEADSWRFAVEAAIKAKADLSEANLSEANLSWANLSEADLSEADLSKADLSKANLSEADLSEANLSKADLSEADLSEANLSKADLSKANLSKANLSKANLSKADLSEADLSEANLSKADLSEADLSEANLSKANLSWADLSVIRNDFWSILLFAQDEIAALRTAIVDGQIDGSTYSTDGCSCLVGTVAKQRKCTVEALSGNLKPDSSRPAERFFMGIKPGDKPKTNPASKIVLEWLDTFVAQTK